MLFNHKSLFTALAVVALATNAGAQKDKVTGSVDVYKDFDAHLLESNKISIKPTLPPLDTSIKRQDYIVPARPLTLTYPTPKLRPIAMKSGKKEETYNGFVKAGAGIPKQFWGEAGYFFNSNEKFDGKVWFRHHSLNNTNNVENQRFFNNDFLLNGNVYPNENLGIEGNIGYTYDRVHFYGYNSDTLSFSEERTRQDIKILDLGGRVYNAVRNDVDFNFSVAPRFYLLNDYYSNKETGFELNLTGVKWFAEKHPLRLNIRTDQTTFDDTVKQKLNNFYLQPSFTYHSDIVQVRIGGNFASNRDEFTILPDAELTLRLVGNGVQIFGGAGGDLRKNTYRSIIEYAPFIQIRGNKLRNTEYRNYYAGAKGDLGFLEYSGQFTYAKANDLALYQTNFTPQGITRFQVVYDDATITNILGVLKLNLFKSLALSGSLSQNLTFELEDESNHWGLPQTEWNFNALFNTMDNKLELRGGLYIADGIWFKDIEGISRQEDVLLDLNAGGTFRFSDNFGVFLDINNILNNKRERWYNYPMVGLNVLGGLTARF
ncbi:MAG: hypothetical protein DYG98_12260 [Haliscomenobacteraceae bacterium CHB4]|nr:hypothetical protein [Saprospiraceae bacterium]MCE7923823.1 hypothetical protein [Haliscomenobacteraceae bacterium CHB4]